MTYSEVPRTMEDPEALFLMLRMAQWPCGIYESRRKRESANHSPSAGGKEEEGVVLTQYRKEFFKDVHHYSPQDPVLHLAHSKTVSKYLLNA